LILLVRLYHFCNFYALAARSSTDDRPCNPATPMQIQSSARQESGHHVFTFDD